MKNTYCYTLNLSASSCGIKAKPFIFTGKLTFLSLVSYNPKVVSKRQPSNSLMGYSISPAIAVSRLTISNILTIGVINLVFPKKPGDGCAGFNQFTLMYQS